jgi:hypothetical protein
VIEVLEEQLEFSSALAFCTRDAQCQAEADEHEPDCPVELELREEFGF